MRRIGTLVIALATLATMGCKGGEKAQPPAQPSAPTPGGTALADLEAEIFGPKCAAQNGCHGGREPAGKMDLTSGHAFGNLVNMKAERRPDRLRVAPGDPEASYLMQRLTPGGDTPLMPFGGPQLPAADLDRIRTWIRAGAKP